MSRDPADGNSFDPKTLHKYLYASGNPVNLGDPTGRDSMLETGSIDLVIDEPALPALREFGGTAARILCVAFMKVAPYFSTWPAGAPSPIGVPVWLIKLIAALCTSGGM
jgi:hypothetical protein